MKRAIVRATPFALLLGVVVGGILVARGTGDGTIGAWGLIGQVTPVYWTLLLVPLGVFAHQLLGSRSTSVLAAALAAEVILLHGAASAAESSARFATSWLHAGFTNQILVSGQTSPDIDARFSWPGFFSAAAVFSAAVGVDPVALLRWAPVFFVLAYLPPLALLIRSLGQSVPTMWVALLLFIMTDWAGQDYFAPQSFGYLLFLIALSITCYAFVRNRHQRAYASNDVLSRRRRRRPLLASWTELPVNPYLPVDDNVRIVLLLLVIAVSAALAMSHQLTPFMLSAVLAALALTNTLRVRLLPVPVTLLTLAWVSFGAIAYWTGHLSTIFGAAGQVTSVVDSGIGSRIAGSQDHRYVLDIRMGFTATFWLAGVVGGVFALKQRTLNLSVAVMALTPFAMLATQSYGGEGVLRIYVFAAPGMAVLAANLLVRFIKGSSVRSVAIALSLALLLPVFMVARFGNESFERIKPGEIEAVNVLYSIAPEGATLVSITPNVPWRSKGLTGYNYEPITLDEFALNRIDLIVQLMGNNPRGSFLIITRGQIVYGQQSYGMAAGWDRNVEMKIQASNRFAMVFRNADGVIYRFKQKGEVRVGDHQ